MADLFDVNVGGAGFHLTSHLIALVALFVACFAIAGYISWRDHSIPPSALDKTADADDDITVNDITATGNLVVQGNHSVAGTHTVGGQTRGCLTATAALLPGAGVNTDFQLGTLPAGSLITDITLSTSSVITTAGSANAGDDLDLSIGTAQGGAQIITNFALLDTGANVAVTLPPNYGYKIIHSGLGLAANGLDARYGDGTNPATSEAIVIGTPGLAHAAATPVWVRFTPQVSALATTGNVTIAMEYKVIGSN